MVEGQRLDEYLGVKKISQTKFGESLGVTKSVVSRWVKHHNIPNGSTIKQIADLYKDFNIRYWLTGEGTVQHSNEEVEAMTSQTDLPKYKMALADKVIEVEDLKRTNRQLMLDFAAFLESQFPPEEVEVMRKVFEKERGIK